MAGALGVDFPFLDAAYRQRPQQDLSSSFIGAYQFAQQQKLAQRRQELEEKQQSILLPLQAEAIRMQTKAVALDLIEKKRKADVALNMKAGNALLAEKMATVDWSNPADRASIWEVGKKYPELLESPEWNRIQQNFINSDKAAIEADKYKTQLEMLRERNQLLQDRIGAGTVTQQDISAAQKLRAQAEALRSAGDAQGYQDKIRQAELLETHVAPKGVVVQSGVDERGNPVSTVSVGGTGAIAQPISATRTAGQQKAIGYELAVEGINDVLRKIGPSDVGISGFVGENVFDKWLTSASEAIGGPSYASGTRVPNRTALRNLRELLFQAFSPERLTGSGFSNKDVARLNELANGLDPSKGYDYVRGSLMEMRRLISERARVQSRESGQPLDDAFRTPDEIISNYNEARSRIDDSVKANRLTPQQGFEQAQKLHQQMLESLQRAQ